MSVCLGLSGHKLLSGKFGTVIPFAFGSFIGGWMSLAAGEEYAVAGEDVHGAVCRGHGALHG